MLSVAGRAVAGVGSDAGGLAGERDWDDTQFQHVGHHQHQTMVIIIKYLYCVCVCVCRLSDVYGISTMTMVERWQAGNTCSLTAAVNT